MDAPGLLTPTLLALIVSAFSALLLTPFIRNFARDRGWVDRPDGRRKLHLTPVPRLGGVAVFCAFTLACALLAELQAFHVVASAISDFAYFHLLVASAAVVVVGVLDDIYDVRPAAKLLVQAAAALYLY